MLSTMQRGYLTRQRAFASVYKRAIKATEAVEGTLLLWDGAFIDRQGLRDWLMPLLHEKINRSSIIVTMAESDGQGSRVTVRLGFISQP